MAERGGGWGGRHRGGSFHGARGRVASGHSGEGWRSSPPPCQLGNPGLKGWAFGVFGIFVGFFSFFFAFSHVLVKGAKPRGAAPGGCWPRSSPCCAASRSEASRSGMKHPPAPSAPLPGRRFHTGGERRGGKCSNKTSALVKTPRASRHVPFRRCRASRAGSGWDAGVGSGVPGARTAQGWVKRAAWHGGQRDQHGGHCLLEQQQREKYGGKRVLCAQGAGPRELWLSLPPPCFFLGLIGV